MIGNKCWLPSLSPWTDGNSPVTEASAGFYLVPFRLDGNLNLFLHI